MKQHDQLAARRWQEYLSIWQRQIASPEILNDPAHIADRQIAHARFMLAFTAKVRANV
jgi:hypothetical protein